MRTVDFSETIAASDLKGSRSRHLIEYMKIVSIEGQGHGQGHVHTKIQTGSYGKVKFGYLGFSMGKSEHSGFFRNYCSM